MSVNPHYSFLTLKVSVWTTFLLKILSDPKKREFDIRENRKIFLKELPYFENFTAKSKFAAVVPTD
ncbi:hypothetical protein B1J93_08145 [Leptospira kirschneri serovar Pomona]|uniref:Uncharacterized protein n=1 Tax=Leptospira kirschneri serovar Pomona TaxID=561005 RepID=A0A1T1DQR6_9LEPT|nr:hypothetical protein LEP1GSC198_3017 [Leptospira kirschneri str. JB]EMK07879.1 hypothetical protein LEP1GSC166_2906 [Leptospira kirschneri]KXZ24935.1 hypothetical protein AYB32_04455 [Leptospira kirschneri]KXZ33134.1 hypothetical protein AYB34_00290 [Leptospira sp. ZV016]OOV43214.1 hypothetical protein B1J93_08145 [Leptospira kirschneri serovar Pomona]